MGNVGLLYGMERTQDKLKGSRWSGERNLDFCISVFTNLFFVAAGYKSVMREGQKNNYKRRLTAQTGQ